MIRPNAFSAFQPIKQKGAVVVLTVTLLLMLITLTTLYTGRSQSFEHQILVNQINHKMAFFAAEAGINRTLTRLKVNGVVAETTINETLSDNSRYTASLSIKAVLTPFGERTFVDISVTGWSEDGLASVVLTEKAIIFPLLTNIPIAPVMAQLGIGQHVNFVVVANENGLGVADPLSIWSSKEVVIHSSNSSTCKLYDFNQNQCRAKGLSTSLMRSSDVQDNTVTFPTNLLGYLFNSPAEQLSATKEWASHVATDCSELNSSSRGLFLITGDCHLELGMQLGNATQPVILIVQDGNLLLDHGVTIFGLLFSYSSSSNSTANSLNMTGGAKVQGALVANYRLGTVTDKFTVIYDRGVLEKLQEQKELNSVARVAGSWRDF